METESNVSVKLEPVFADEESQHESSSKVLPREEINIKTEPNEENSGVKLESAAEESSSAPESIMVKLEPKYYSSGDGHGGTAASLSSQNPAKTQSSTSLNNTTQRPQTFVDLLKIWENNEEKEEFGYFFAYCRATADCGGYYFETDTDESDDEAENLSKCNHDTSKYYVGRNGYKWSKTPLPVPGNQSAKTPSCTKPSERNVYNLWASLVDNSMLHEILKWTNVKLEECKVLIGDLSNPYLEKLDIIELKAFFGSIIYSTQCKRNIHPVEEMYTDDLFYRPVFNSIMSKNRFLSILNCLSFGDSQLENQTSERNIAILFQKFVENCEKMYKGSSYAVIAETVVPFWGDAKDDRFPGKYTEWPCRDGFRLPCMFDVKTGFLYNMYIPYTDIGNCGFVEEEQQFQEGTKIALLLTKPIHGTNVNVTCNKEYMSLELVEAFTKYGLTCLGPLQTGHNQIPPEFLPSKKRQKGNVLYAYSDKATLMSYMNKRRKATIIASSKPCSIDEKAEKPRLLQLYKQTKYARMLTDEEFNLYRRTKLISMALFYKLFDFSILNTYILYSLNMNSKVEMRKVVELIAEELCHEHWVRRAADATIPGTVRSFISSVLTSKQGDDADDIDDYSSTDSY